MRFTICTLVAVALAGCAAKPSPSSTSTGTVVHATVGRDTAPLVSGSDEEALVAGNTDFAFALYPGINSASGATNLFYSPYSVSLALAMATAGAHGETATQMNAALDFTLPQASLNPAFDKLDLEIQAPPAAATGADGAPFALTLADSLWGDAHVTFDQDFVNTLASDYGAGLRTVDFAAHAADAETAINTWVANETNDKIDPLLSPGALQSNTEFVIVNAVYFNAAWASQFDKTATATGTFTRADASTVQTPMMSSASVATTYLKGTNFQAVELPYSGRTTSMVIVLPDDGAFSAVESSLSGGFFSNVTASLQGGVAIDLKLPGFTVKGATVSLAAALEGLGMTDAFDSAKADFTAMIPAGGVFISDVLHQAFVDVDESGTEAAAATAVVGVTDAEPGNRVTVEVNRPFFFFIRDVATNTVLFVGRESDPTAN